MAASGMVLPQVCFWKVQSSDSGWSQDSIVRLWFSKIDKLTVKVLAGTSLATASTLTSAATTDTFIVVSPGTFIWVLAYPSSTSAVTALQFSTKIEGKKVTESSDFFKDNLKEVIIFVLACGGLLVLIALVFLWIKCKDPDRFPNKVDVVPFNNPEAMRGATADPNRTYMD